MPARIPTMTHDHNFVPATPEQVETIRKQLGTDEEDIKKTIASLRDWLRMQPHLPDAIDDAHIERMYIHCKCSTEKVKKGLDAYFSMRNRYPEILMNRDPLGPDIKHTTKHMKFAVMPRLTKELYRVHIIGGIDPDPTWVSWPKHGKTASIAIEMMYFDDYSLGDVIIYDMTNLNAGHILRTDINIIRALEIGYKVHVHLPGSTTLFDHVPKEYLPDELGGTAGPFDKFAYEFIGRAEKKRYWFMEQDRYTSDESKRPPDNHYTDDMYGVAGSFKKLSVD
ncbi:uncharacterized protein LOC124615269 isoform X2 [Schistocerca americana]|uniref:uncharacterized protein LOC124615269 isoform X2 n=1 Tax=Schistocerca americana TaxID=7009 RepID=UPI001F4F8A60|nr:uncharacterized protein LOC124615269 isoform X2 [Schistocerca americana]